MNTIEEKLEWIATASYEELLRRWRWEPIGSPWFKGELGPAFRKRMQQLRESMSISECVEVSRRVSWDRGVNLRDFKDV